MILQTLSNILIRKHIFYSFIKNVSHCYRQVKPSNYFAHHNFTSSARVIDLCCSTSVDDFATNKVIDMFDYLVFNNCWCVFDSILHEKSVLHMEWWTLHSTFWDEWRHGHWLWYKFCISVVIFFSSSGEWGGHCPHHQLNRYMLWTPICWHFFNVLKLALFVSNGNKLEVFLNHNIS